MPQSRLSRAFAVITGILLLALGLFFFTLFLAVGAIALAVVIARVIWGAQQIKAHASNEIIEAEYSVEKKESETEQSRTERALSDDQAGNKRVE